MHKYLFDLSYYYRYVYLLNKNGLKKILNIDDWKIFPQIQFELKNEPFPIRKDINADLLKKISLKTKPSIDYEKLFDDNLTTTLIIFKNNKIIYEKYNYGINENSIQRILSISKIFISALIGILIKEKKINDINDNIEKYLPEIKGNFLSKKTIKELLVMDGGINYSEGNYPWNHWSKFSFSPDIEKLLYSAKTHDGSGEYFHYNNFYACLLVKLIKQLTSDNLSKYLTNKILIPIGCSGKFSINIDSYRRKFEKLDMGLNCSAINLLRIGILYLNNGVVNNNKVLNSSWVSESTSFENGKNNKKNTNQYLGENIRHLFFGKKNTFFKYYWWGYQTNEEGYDYFSVGKLGQIIYINKSKGVVFIRLGKKWTGKIGISEVAYDITNSI